MPTKKKVPVTKKPMSLRERMANRHKQIDQASGFEEPEKKQRKIPLPKKYQ